MDSTTAVTSWNVDMSTLGPIYPFVGTEFALVIAGVLFWIFFHISQLRAESKTYEEDLSKLRSPEAVQRALGA